MGDLLVTSGQAAKELGVSVSLLRKLEMIGASPPPRRLSRFRVYSAGEIEELRRVISERRAQRNPQPEQSDAAA